VFGGPGTTWRDNLATFFKGRANSDVFRMTIFTPLPGSKLHERLAAEGRISSFRPEDYYYGKYVIRDEHNPRSVRAAYFGLQLLHYLLPDTLVHAAADSNRARREFNRRAYRGAFEFVLGSILRAGRARS